MQADDKTTGSDRAGVSGLVHYERFIVKSILQTYAIVAAGIYDVIIRSRPREEKFLTYRRDTESRRADLVRKLV